MMPEKAVDLLRACFRYLAWPALLFGFGGAIVIAADAGFGVAILLAILSGAIAFSFLTERLIPWRPEWNRDHGDSVRDGLHAVTNLTLNRVSLWLLPGFAWLELGNGVWPSHWPYAFQVFSAVLVLDAGIAAAHHLSHRSGFLWRFHAVHHSSSRLYGFNGLMKHPIHQTIEMLAGSMPLILLGIPYDVAITLPFLVAISLLCQHINADIRTGIFRYLFANAEVHRFHHRRHGDGDINFGLFTNIYDHMMGTYYYRDVSDCVGEFEVGLHSRMEYPIGYLDQLREPFRNFSRVVEASRQGAKED
jgi:sterol desaturase/sphingolipid hydroxylase (fatty acid hydroxylase superfamily)